MEETDRVISNNRRAGWVWLLLTAAMTATFWHCFGEMWRRWFPAWDTPGLTLYEHLVHGESYYTHGPVVPLVSLMAAVLIIRHRRMMIAPRPLLGGLLLGLFFLLQILSSLARVNFISVFSFIGVLASLVVLLWGTQCLRRLWFPLTFLVFMAPLPEITISQLNFELKSLAAAWGIKAASLMGIVVENSGSKVFLSGDKSLLVTNVCSGLRTLISLLAFGALYSYVCRLRGLWRVWLFAMAVPVAVVSNALRIMLLILVAEFWDVRAASGWFHDLSGVLTFFLAFLLMFGLERLVLGAYALFGRKTESRPLNDPLDGERPDDQWERLFRCASGRSSLIAAGVLMLLAAGTYAMNRSVPPEWSPQIVNQAVPREIVLQGDRLHGYDRQLDERTLTILETRDYVLRHYVGARPGEAIDFCAVFSPDNRKGIHPPDLCMEGGGQTILQKSDIEAPAVAGGPPVPCREFIVLSGATRYYYLYTFKYGNRYTRSFWQQQVSIFLSGLLQRPAEGMLIHISTPIGADEPAARRRCMDLLGLVVPRLDEVTAAVGEKQGANE